MPVIIDPIYRIGRPRFKTDFFQELFKRVKPKFYSATPVMLKSYVVGIITSLFSALVGPIFRRRATASEMTVARVMVVPVAETATAFGIAPLEVKPQDNSDIAAFTEAFPESIPFSISSGKTNNGKPAGFVTYDILGSSHAVRTSSTNGLVRFGRLFKQPAEPLRL